MQGKEQMCCQQCQIFINNAMRDVKIDSKSFASKFTICWEHEFPSQKDISSCGLFIVMYAGTKLGLINIERLKETNVRLRNIIASELLQCHLEPRKNRENKQPACKVFSSCKQACYFALQSYRS